jgi:hypothetical protein
MSTLRRPPSGNRPNRNWGIATELDHRTGVLPERLRFKARASLVEICIDYG